MKIGFLQFSPVLGDVAATIERIEERRGDFRHADLVVFPELCNSGYSFASAAEARASAEDAQTGRFVQYLSRLSRAHRQYIVSGLNEWGSDSAALYNAAVLIGPQGYIGRYRKLHLFMEEKDIFQPGDLGLPVFDIGHCRVGLLVCFDWIFPEAWRVLALAGADIICHPSNLVLPGLAQRAVPIHALSNRLFVITANRVGREGERVFTGLSTIADPAGTILAQAPEAEPAVMIVEIDPAEARNKMITPRNDVLGDRRPDAYQALVRDSD